MSHYTMNKKTSHPRMPDNVHAKKQRTHCLPADDTPSKKPRPYVMHPLDIEGGMLTPMKSSCLYKPSIATAPSGPTVKATSCQTDPIPTAASDMCSICGRDGLSVIGQFSCGHTTCEGCAVRGAISHARETSRWETDTHQYREKSAFVCTCFFCKAPSYTLSFVESCAPRARPGMDVSDPRHSDIFIAFALFHEAPPSSNDPETPADSVDKSISRIPVEQRSILLCLMRSMFSAPGITVEPSHAKTIIDKGLGATRLPVGAAECCLCENKTCGWTVLVPGVIGTKKPTRAPICVACIAKPLCERSTPGAKGDTHEISSYLRGAPVFELSADREDYEAIASAHVKFLIAMFPHAAPMLRQFDAISDLGVWLFAFVANELWIINAMVNRRNVATKWATLNLSIREPEGQDSDEPSYFDSNGDIIF